MSGEILKKIIDNKGISIYKLAKDTGINRQTIANYIDKNNMISIDKANIIAQYLNITMDYLFTGKGSMLKEASPNFVSEPQASYLGNPNQNLDRENELKTQLKDKERIISMLEKEVLRLENELKKFTL